MFSNIFQEFLTIYEDVRRFSKIAEDIQGRSEDVPMIHYEFKCNLGDKLDIFEIIDIFTCEDIVLFLSICYHLVYR